MKKGRKRLLTLMTQPVSSNIVYLQHFLYYTNYLFIFSSILFFPFGKVYVSMPHIVCCWALSPILPSCAFLSIKGFRNLQTVLPRLTCKNGSQLDLTCGLEARRKETLSCFQCEQVQQMDLWVPGPSAVPGRGAAGWLQFGANQSATSSFHQLSAQGRQMASILPKLWVKLLLLLPPPDFLTPS